MIIPVSPNVHKATEEKPNNYRDYTKEIEQRTYEGIIWSCEHIDKCGHPLAVGKCMDECFKRYLRGCE